MSTTAKVNLWGRTIGAVSLEDGAATATFEYDRAFINSGIEVAPLMMPLSSRLYSFPVLQPETFHGLPGLLADSLPDRFGNVLIDSWLARETHHWLRLLRDSDILDGRHAESMAEDCEELLEFSGSIIRTTKSKIPNSQFLIPD